MKRDASIGNPSVMDLPPLTCELVDQRELDRRYVAGQLDEVEAAAFEAHYFGCDRCWHLVKTGAGLRAALAGGAAVPAARARTWWRPLALAAGIGIVVLGVWRAVGPQAPAGGDAFRGLRDSIAVRSGLSVGVWRTEWTAVPEAASYRIRVFAGEGRVLLTRESQDTSAGLPADSLAALGGGDTLYLEVQGFDRLRRLVARSPLIPLPQPSGAPPR